MLLRLMREKTEFKNNNSAFNYCKIISLVMVSCPEHILVSSSLNWIKNEMISYRTSELMLATLIQRYDKKSFHFKNERLTEIL